MNKILSKSLENYINYVKSHIDYGIMESQQIARTNIQLIDCTKNKVSKVLIMKHITYEHINDYIYLLVHSDFLISGERLGQDEMRKLRYKLFTIKEMEKLFDNTIDVFYNGYKIPYNEVRVALFDDYFIIELPQKYKDYASINVLLHSHVFNELYNKGTIEIPKSKINDIEKEKDNFFVFVDKKQTNNFSISEDNNKFTIRVSQQGSLFEVVYMRNLNYYGKTNVTNSHINIMDVKKKFPIAAHNIITFSNGLLINLGLTAKTDGIFKSNLNINNTIDLFYLYKDYKNENAEYNDQYRWLATYLDNFMDIINNPSMLPEFANKFELFKNDISLQNFLANNYTDNDKYNYDNALDTIKFCEECLMTFLDFFHEQYKDSFITCNYYKNLSELGKNNLIRNNNHQEIMNIDNRAEFSIPMVMIKIPNEEGYPYVIYVDGIRFYDYNVKYRENGFDYVYIDSKKINDDSYIEIEKIRTKQNLPNQISILSNGTTTLRIKLDIDNFIKTESDLKFISLAKTVNEKLINDNKNISSVEINESNNELLIHLKQAYDDSTILQIYNMNFYKTYTVNTRVEDSGYDFVLSEFDGSLENLNHIRIFKNGKEIPRSFYNIELPEENNNLSDPKIHMDISYYVYEFIEIEYSPDEYIEEYYRDTLKVDGKIDILNPENLENKFISKSINYFNLNGQRITPAHYKYWCSKGISLFNYNSVKFFVLMNKSNSEFRELISNFIEAYKINKKLLDIYIIGLMNGEIYDPDNPPLKTRC